MGMASVYLLKMSVMTSTFSIPFLADDSRVKSIAKIAFDLNARRSPIRFSQEAGCSWQLGIAHRLNTTEERLWTYLANNTWTLTAPEMATVVMKLR